jgi:ABC-type bacteriocin/lantibiotic exporter with double-glycine peptidase domain
MIRQSTTRGSASTSTSTAAYATINGAIWAIYVALVLLVTQVLAFADPLMITASVLITALALRPLRRRASRAAMRRFGHR